LFLVNGGLKVSFSSGDESHPLHDDLTGGTFWLVDDGNGDHTTVASVETTGRPQVTPHTYENDAG